ncbi:MAG: hypothetical protein ABJL99_17410 [Aliishimia sp.]
MTFSQRLADFFTGNTVNRRRPCAKTELAVTTGAEGHLNIPIPDPTAEDRIRDSWQDRGQKLARQEDWEELSDLLQKSDKNRMLTPGGMSVAELVAFGARADAVGAAEHALLEGMTQSTTPLLSGIEGLEAILAEHPADYSIAVVIALTHMDLAWAWRGNGKTAQVPQLNMEAFKAHMDRARDVLDGFCGRKIGSPLLLSACCTLTRSTGQLSKEVACNYETLIDFNPLDVRQMRALGTSLLPRWDGSYHQLDLEARRTGARLSELWGAGGYTWVMLDAISVDAEACAGLDVDYFLDGLHDILALRADQFTVNLLAAFCAVTMAEDTGNDAADLNRARIRDARAWIVCDYMTELHPLIWAHAAHGFDNAIRVRSVDSFANRGAAEARRVLNGIFMPELARGQNVVFTENGPKLQMP